MRRLVLGAAAGLAVAIAVAGTTYAVAAVQTGRATMTAAAPATFAHPGVFVSRAQLDFVRGKVQAGAQPWKAAYDQMMGSRYASLSRSSTAPAATATGSCP